MLCLHITDNFAKDQLPLFPFLYKSMRCACCRWSSVQELDWRSAATDIRSGDWLGNWKISHLFVLRHSWLAFPVCFGSFPISTVACCPISFTALCTSQFIVLLLSGVTVTSGSDLVTVMHGHAIALSQPCLTDNVMFFTIISSSFPSPSFSLPIILVQADFGFICPKSLIVFPELWWLF